MGEIQYAGMTLEFDDRLLTHLPMVIRQRFRRDEAFLRSWADDIGSDDGRGSARLIPDEPIASDFNGSKAPGVDQRWIDRSPESAVRPRGLVVTAADGALVRPGPPSARNRSAGVARTDSRRRGAPRA